MTPAKEVDEVMAGDVVEPAVPKSKVKGAAAKAPSAVKSQGKAVGKQQDKAEEDERPLAVTKSEPRATVVAAGKRKTTLEVASASKAARGGRSPAISKGSKAIRRLPSPEASDSDDDGGMIRRKKPRCLIEESDDSVDERAGAAAPSKVLGISKTRAGKTSKSIEEAKQATPTKTMTKNSKISKKRNLEAFQNGQDKEN